MIRITAAVVALLVGCLVSYRITIQTLAANRSVEFSANEKAGPLSEENMHWTIVHIRDDVGAIHNLLVIANGLLAAILAVQIF